MDLDVFVSAHRAEWDRLDALLRRQRRLTGAEVDELVALYQRTATHLSLIQSSAPDPQLTGRLSQLVARARSAVTGTRRASWRDVTRFLTARFPRGGLPIAPLVGPHRAPLHGGGGSPGLVDRHAPRGAVLHRGPRRTARPDPPRWRVRDVLLQPPRRFLRRPGVDEQRPGRRDVPGPGRLPLLPGHLDPLPEHAQRGRRHRPDVLGGPTRHLPRPDPAARPPGTDRGLRRRRHGPAPRLDGHRPRPAFPPHGTGRGRTSSPGHGDRPGPGPLRLGRHRRLRHPVGPAHLGAHHASASSPNWPSSRTSTSSAVARPAPARQATSKRSSAAPPSPRLPDVRTHLPSC